ncbi:MAG: hypothetical protein JWN62_1959 [Acidimicrobiales bacterium]|nr:hypothetical protein [Acidimicrobiales bacterium]
MDVAGVGQRRLLALLALQSRRSVRAQLMSEALGMSPGALRNSMSRLRRLVGETAIATTSVGYRLDLDVDSDDFCRSVANLDAHQDRVAEQRRALALWVGPALGEFQHESWAHGEAVRLTELHAAAVEELAAELINRCCWTEAIATLGQLVTDHPFRDRPRGLMIRALAGAGRQAEALRAYQDYRMLLAEEVGTEPSADVRQIERRVAQGWDGVEVVAPTSGATSRWSPPAVARWSIPLHGPLARDTAVVGRARELGWLAADLARAPISGLRTVILSGEAGIGKTTLMSAFGRELHESGAATVLYARCDEGTTVPLQPFVSLVGLLVEHAPTAMLEAHVARCGGDLMRIAPHLAHRVRAVDNQALDEGTGRFMLFEAVGDIIRRASEVRPLVVLLDDLHWAEPTAAQLLRHLGRSLVDAPVLMVVAVRDPGEQRNDDVRSALADLQIAHAHNIPLTGFTDAEVIELLVSITDAGREGAAAIASRVHLETAGNPLYAAQLLRHWVESDLLASDPDGVRFAGDADEWPVPPSLRDVVWSRVRALGPDAPAILSAAAVLGGEFRTDVLIDMLDVGEAEIMDALDAALDAGLLLEVRSASSTLRFTHSLVANAAYGELRGLHRGRMHERAARALQKTGDVPSQKLIAQLARHCDLGGLTAEAQGWATAAGDHAIAHLAPSEAAAWYRKALDHATALGRSDEELADLMVRLGEAQLRAGDPLALTTLSAGADIAVRCGADSVLIRAALGSDRGFMRLGEFAPEQLQMVEAALAAADPSDVETYARLLALFGQSLVHTTRNDLRIAVGSQALELAAASPDATLLPRVARGVLNALWGSGDNRLRAEIAVRAVELAEASGDPFLCFGAFQSAYEVAIETANPDWAASNLCGMRRIADHIGEPRMRWVVGLCDTFDLTMRAEFDEAERIAGATYELGASMHEADAFTLYAGQFFALRTFTGRHGELFPIVEQATTSSPELLPFRLAYGIICSAIGREPQAREVLAEGMCQRFGNVHPDLLWMTSTIGYAILAIELEDRDAAEVLISLIEPFAADVSYNGGTSQGPVSAYVGKLASLLGRHEAAEQHLLAALCTATSFGWEYHRATTLIDLARSRYRRDGVLDSDSCAWLDEAETICAERGIVNWAGRIEKQRRDARLTR